MRRKTIVIGAVGLTAGVMLSLALWERIVSNVEHSKYRVVEKHESIEIRQYNPMIVAEVETEGERDLAIKQGFRLLADYIFGGNISAEKVAMTVPVTQQKNEKIAMTTPVTQENVGNNRWKIHFMMPSTYTLASLPTPSNPAVKLKEVESKRFVVIRFSGRTTESNIKTHEDQLNHFIKEKNIKPLAAATYAFFNPPWTLPFLRRNEVMIEVENQ